MSLCTASRLVLLQSLNAQRLKCAALGSRVRCVLSINSSEGVSRVCRATRRQYISVLQYALSVFYISLNLNQLLSRVCVYVSTRVQHTRVCVSCTCRLRALCTGIAPSSHAHRSQQQAVVLGSLLRNEPQYPIRRGMLQPPPHTTTARHTHSSPEGWCILSMIEILDLLSSFQLRMRRRLAGLGSTQRASRLLLFCLLRHEVNKRVVLGVG